MYRLTDIEPARLEGPGNEVSVVPGRRNACGAIAQTQGRERFLIVTDTDQTEAQCLGFVRRLARENDEIWSLKATGSDPAGEVSRLANTFEVDWVCLMAQRGEGLRSLFLTKNTEKILRSSPCLVICIPELYGSAENLPGSSEGVTPIRRILVPIKPPLNNRRTVECAVELAQRCGAKLDLLGVEEVARQSGGPRGDSHRSARREQTRAVREEMRQLSAGVIPNQLRGRRFVSVGLPFFHATLRRTRELRPDVIALSVPKRLWLARGRIDVATESILHGATCPVVCLHAPAQSRTNILTRFPSERASGPESEPSYPAVRRTE
jgi:nucleotide-binding universal stress UspA family protein